MDRYMNVFAAPKAEHARRTESIKLYGPPTLLRVCAAQVT